MPTRMLLLILIFASHTAWGASSLLRDVLYQEQADHIELSIRLGVPVEIFEMEEEDRILHLGLRSEQADPDGQWRAAELRFEEADRLLETVSLEGSDRKGFRLSLSFTEPVVAHLLPQFDRYRVILKLARRADYRDLSRFRRAGNKDAYVINLESRHESVPVLEDLPPGFDQTHTVYLTRFEKDGTLWHRLRIGFFDNQTEALSTANVLRRYYPEAWVDQAGTDEVRFAEAFQINPSAYVAAGNTAAGPALSRQNEEPWMKIELATPASLAAEPESEPASAPVSRERRAAVEEQPPGAMEVLQDEARRAFEDENWPSAINRYGAIVEAGQEPYRQHALEMLGVSRELNDQMAHAKRYYELYLAEYADTEGARRVAQRLATMTAFDRPERPTGGSRPAMAVATRWQTGLQFSQFYSRHQLSVDGRRTVPVNGLINDFNLMTRRDGALFDQEMRITMSYLLDLTDNERLKGRAYQVSSAYWEGYSESLNAGIRIGRQSNWQSGALGRFDGGSLNYRFTDNLGFALTGGFLIDASYMAPNGDRPFFGFGGEYLTDSGNLSFKPFFVQQYADGMLDRQAVGLQSQYYSDRMMVFSLIDYDMHFSALNNFTMTGNFSFGRSQLNASYEHRRNPYLTTRNALMGQTFDDLTDFEEALLDLNLEAIAADRTAQSDTVRLGWNSRFGSWTLSADVVATDFSRTESSAEVVGLEPHKTLYSSFQIRSADVFGRGSYSGLMLRLADSDTSDTTSLYWDNRFSLRGNWFFYPRLRVDLRKFSRTGDEQTTVRPTLRLDYRMSRRIRFELEGGYEWSSRDMADRQLDISGVFFRAGYRANL